MVVDRKCKFGQIPAVCFPTSRILYTVPCHRRFVFEGLTSRWRRSGRGVNTQKCSGPVEKFQDLRPLVQLGSGNENWLLPAVRLCYLPNIIDVFGPENRS